MTSYNITNELDRYELSLWSHNDRFLNMLRTSVSFVGEAYGVTFKENINGDRELVFSIPLYIFDTATDAFIKNPLWNNIVNEQKIRLIKNKELGATAEIYDFVIKNFVESRDGFQKTATVTCKSYAIYELSKIGFSATLNESTLENEDLTISAATINFWMGQILPYTRNAYSLSNTAGWKFTNTSFYEKDVITGYTKEEGSDLWVPIAGATNIEKERIISVDKSNVFNMVQELAEKFQVWASFVYTYNAAFQVVGREIVFYEEAITNGEYVFSYGVNINTISRTTNTDSIVTKMYVQPIESEYEDDGLMSIADAEQNLMQENFLYNFDYYRGTGLISESQYTDFLVRQSEIRDFNMQIKPLDINIYNQDNEKQQLVTEREFIEFQLVGAQAVRTEINNKISICQTDPITLANPTGKKGIIDHWLTIKMSGFDYIVDLSYRQGIEYNSFTNFKNSLGAAITPVYTVIYDNEDPSLVLGLNFGETNPDTGGIDRIYVSYTFDPLAYLYKLLLSAESKISTLTSYSSDLSSRIDNYDLDIIALQASLDALLVSKEEKIAELETALSAVLKEGNWQDNSYILKKDTKVFDDEAVTVTEESVLCYHFKTDLNLIDFASIQLWKQDGANFPYQYSQYTDYTIEYGNEDGDNALLFVPVDTTGAFIVNQLDSPASTLIGDNSTLYIRYKQIESDTYLTGSVTRATCNVATRSFVFTETNILQHSIKIYPLYSDIILEGQEQYDYLVEGTDYIISTSYDELTLALTTEVELKPTQNALHLDAYPKIIFDVNDSLEKFYYDAVDVLKRSAFPTISFDINVVDLSSLPGYENFKPAVGQMIYIVDYEMFPVDVGDLPPFGLSGFISEINYNFDNPAQTTVTISNYKTKFEDIFQRIVASSETVQYRETTFETLGQILNPNKTIDFDVIQSSINNNSLVLSSGNRNSVVWGSDGVTITDMSGDSPIPSMIKIVGNGIFLSYKNGSSNTREWTTAITPRGINATAITVGQLDTKSVNIWNSNEIRFTWNSEGLFAFGESDNGATDFQTFVKFNQDGLQFQRLLDVGTEYESTYTELGLTWEGLEINGQKGAVKLTSDYGLQVFDSLSRERIQIGALSSSDNYGMRLKDVAGTITLETDSVGKLWLKDSLYVGSESSTIGLYGGGYPTVRQVADGTSGEDTITVASNTGIYVGQMVSGTGIAANAVVTNVDGTTIVLSDVNTDDLTDELITFYSVAIWAGDTSSRNAPFRVDYDGNLFASNVDLTGAINATSGNFSGVVYIGEEGSDNRIVLNQIANTISSEDYSKDVKGWMVNGDGFAEFESVLVRGEFKSTVFTYDEISAQGGSLIIAEAATFYEDIEKGAGATTLENFKIKKNNIALQYLFAEGDTLKVETYISAEQKIIIWLKITSHVSFTNDYSVYTADILSNSSHQGEVIIIPKGAAIINFGSEDSGYILMRSDDSSRGSYIKMIENTGTDGVTGLLTQTTKLMLGDLSGESLGSFTNLNGYGLYADNVYLTGKLFLPSVGISDEDNTEYFITIDGEDHAIRIWAGTESPDNRVNAPFYVTDKGYIFAARGTFGGVFTGSFTLGDILISDTTPVTDGLASISFVHDTYNPIEISAEGSHFTTPFYLGLPSDRRFIVDSTTALLKTNQFIISQTESRIDAAKDIVFPNSASDNLMQFNKNSHNIDIIDSEMLFNANSTPATYNFKFRQNSGLGYVSMLIDGSVEVSEYLGFGNLHAVKKNDSGNIGIDFLII